MGFYKILYELRFIVMFVRLFLISQDIRINTDIAIPMTWDYNKLLTLLKVAYSTKEIKHVTPLYSRQINKTDELIIFNIFMLVKSLQPNKSSDNSILHYTDCAYFKGAPRFDNRVTWKEATSVKLRTTWREYSKIHHLQKYLKSRS